MAEREVTSTEGGQQNCTFGAVQMGPKAVFKSCFNSMTFAHNAIIGPFTTQELFSEERERRGLVHYNHGQDGDYHLCKDKNQPPTCKTCKKASPYLMREATGRTWPISTPSKPQHAVWSKTRVFTDAALLFASSQLAWA